MSNRTAIENEIARLRHMLTTLTERYRAYDARGVEGTRISDQQLDFIWEIEEEIERLSKDLDLL